MSTDLIRYDLQVQDALRGVVRKVLSEAARDGLPGEHHFYITFRTQSAGVKLSSRLREQYPEEMTIILQHQFWDLKVDDISLEVGLHFKNIPEKLHVPFDAIVGFYDPSVQFGLKFEAQGEETDEFDDEDEMEVGPAANKPVLLREEKPKPRGAGSEPKLSPAKLDAPAKFDAPAAKEPAKKPVAVEPSAPGDAPKVVSIDAFRKKP